MYKIAFIDIDNTLLDHNIHDFDMESIEALKKAKEKGLIIYLCTARNYFATKTTGILKLLNPDGVLCTNGAFAYSNNKLLFANIIPEEVAKQIEKQLNIHHITAQFSSPYESHLINKRNKYLKKYFEVYKEEIPRVKKYLNKDITSMLMFAPIKYDEIFKKVFPKEVIFRRYHEYGCDLAYYKWNKGLGIRKLLNILNISKEYAFAIGDNNDDISMFSEVKLGVAMGNANEDAKKAADMIIKPISEHGIKHLLIELNLI